MRFVLPRIKWIYRLLLYICMAVFSVISIASLVYTEIPFLIEIAIYIAAVISLSVGFIYLVHDIKYLCHDVIKNEIKRNKYTGKLAEDFRLRTIVLTVPGAGMNVLFAIFNGVMGAMSSSAWLGSMSAYYIFLGMMRVDAVRQSRKIVTMDVRQRMKKEIKIYKRNSQLFMFMVIVTVGMVILLISSEGGKIYPGYMIYVAAMYSFYKIINSTIHLIRVGREKSPLLTILRRIGYLDSCVSILILQTAMFASFGDGRVEMERLMNGLTGSSVCVIVFTMGLYGIITAKKLENNLIER